MEESGFMSHIEKTTRLLEESVHRTSLNVSLAERLLPSVRPSIGSGITALGGRWEMCSKGQRSKKNSSPTLTADDVHPGASICRRSRCDIYQQEHGGW